MASQLYQVEIEDCRYLSPPEAERTTEEETSRVDTPDKYGSGYSEESATDMTQKRSGKSPETLDSEPELEVRDRFMVMPKRKEQIQRLRATKVQYKYYEQLPVDIKLNVMLQAHPDDLLNFICANQTTAWIWKLRKLSIMRGMQEERFAEFATVFDKFGTRGRQGTWELCKNFKKAERSLRILDEAKAKENQKMQTQLDKYGQSSPWRQLALLGFMKGHLDEELNAMYNMRLAIPQTTLELARQGLLLLWQMRWELFALTESRKGSCKSLKHWTKRLMGIFNRQPSDVRSSAAEILSSVVSSVVRQLDFKGARCGFSYRYYQTITHQTLQTGDLKLWIHGTMVAFVIGFLLTFGVAQTLHLVTPSVPATVLYMSDKLLADFKLILARKIDQDHSGTSGVGFGILKLGMGLAQGMDLEIPELLGRGESFRRQLSVCGVSEA